ncbi:MAG: PucR family transcriptional regulator ligand-binding domain-containing protein [Gordonia sp. (in: high G+C Gram-positive bacteria)]
MDSHALPLREVITRHLARADPHVRTAHDRLETPVHWVHSSEIFEIGPLLTGGELLLTTGLGLTGLDAGTRRHYVRDLADRGVAGLAFETGRSFDAIPEEMIREGSAAHLPIIELRAVVPFLEVCRNANTELVSGELADLRARNALDATLHADLAAGATIPAFLGHLATATGSPLVLVGSGGALLAAHGVDDDRAAWQVVDAAVAIAGLTVRGRELGRLAAGASTTGVRSSQVAALIEVAAAPLAATLARSAGGGSPVGARLIADLLEPRSLRRADLLARLASAFGPVNALVAVAADAPDPRMAETALTHAVPEGGGLIVAVVDATVYALVLLRRGPGPDATEQVRAAWAAPGARFDGVTVVIGDPCPVAGAGPGTALSAALTDALRCCGERLALAGRLLRDGSERRSVFTTRELAAIAAVRALPAPICGELLRLVEPLAEHDAAQSTQLVTTVAVYLRHGCSATRSAAVLHIGRQSLYQRLERIRTILGFDPADPACHAAMTLAVTAFTAYSDAERMTVGRARTR